MSFSKLPEDLIEYIMMNLSPYGELQVCRLVSKRWNRLCHGAALRLKRLCDRCDSFEWLFLQQPQELTSGKYAPNIAERCSHAACYHAASGSIFVFGGCTAAYTTFNDLWKFDLATRAWKRPIPGGTPPTPKACATMVEYRGKLAIFGGWSKSSPNPIHQTAMFFNELHIYDPVNNDWRSMENDGSAPHLAGHSATLLGHQMIVFGGSHGSGSSNNVPPQGNLIPPRRKLISSRSLDEQNSPPSPKSEERKTAELQRARSIPTIIVGEIPKLVVTAEDNSGDSSGSDSSTSGSGFSSSGAKMHFRPSSPPPKSKHRRPDSFLQSRNPMNIYVLDMSRVLSERLVSWQVLEGNNDGPEDTSGSLKICLIPDELKEKLKRFRSRKETTVAAIVLKIKKDSQEIVIDEELQVLISYRLVHSDGRCNPELQMLYAGSKNNIVNESGVSKDFELRDLEDLTDEFLQEKLT